MVAPATVVVASATVVVAPATVVVAPETVVVAPAIVEEVAPGTVVWPAMVVVVASSFLMPDCNTGRSNTSPVRPTISSARCWSFTPGRLMTTVLPWRIISGSATPIESTRERMISTATSSATVS